MPLAADRGVPRGARHRASPRSPSGAANRAARACGARCSCPRWSLDSPRVGRLDEPPRPAWVGGVAVRHEHPFPAAAASASRNFLHAFSNGSCGLSGAPKIDARRSALVSVLVSVTVTVGSLVVRSLSDRWGPDDATELVERAVPVAGDFLAERAGRVPAESLLALPAASRSGSGRCPARSAPVAFSMRFEAGPCAIGASNNTLGLG
jgi:hypothetical protein